MKKRIFSLGLSSLNADEINELTNSLLKSQEKKRESFNETCHEINTKLNNNSPLNLKKVKASNSNHGC